MSDRQKLTPKERLFVQLYLISLNATKAAREAGYSAESARQIGSDLRAKAYISRAIEKAMEARTRRTKVTQDRVIRELERIAFSDMDDFATVVSGRLKIHDSSKRKEGCSRVIKKITQSESDSKDGGSFSQGLELHDKMKALDLLGRHVGLFKRDSEDEDEGEPDKSIKLKYSTNDPEGGPKK